MAEGDYDIVSGWRQDRKEPMLLRRIPSKFGNLVMEGRDIGTNIFPETDFKFYLDASLEERTRRIDKIVDAIIDRFFPEKNKMKR